MKRLTLLLSLIVLLLPAAGLAGESPWEKELPFKNATIAYSLSGMQNGTETLYVRDYGRETALHTEAKSTMMGMTMVTKEIEIITPDWIFNYNITDGEGIKSTNPQKFMIEEYNKLSASEKKQVDKNAEKMGIAALEGFNGEVEKNAESFLGYKCDKVTVMGSTIYTIHGTDIPLKTDVDMMGMKMTIIATSLDKGQVAAKHFEHPAGIQAVYDKESDIAARSVAKQTMEMLKDPDAADKGGNLPQQGLSEEEMQEMEQAMEALKSMLGNQQ